MSLLGFNPATKQAALDYAKKELTTSIFKVYCETCNTVFLECFFPDFLSKTNSGKWAAINVPDKWFCNAIIHHSRNPDHNVLVKQPTVKIPFLGELKMFPDSLSEVWTETNRLHGISLKANIEYYEKCLAGASGKSEV